MVDGELKPNVIVVAAANNIVARAKLCKEHGVKNVVLDDPRSNNAEGIKTIRLSDTNVWEKKEDSIDEETDSM